MQAFGMADWGAWNTIDEYPRAQGGEKNRHPFPPTWTKSEMPHRLEQEWPGDGIKCPGYIKLQEDSGNLEIMQETGSLLHQDKIVMDTTANNERALTGRHQLT